MAANKRSVLSLFGPENDYKGLCSKIEMLKNKSVEAGCKGTTLQVLNMAVSSYLESVNIALVDSNNTTSNTVLNTNEDLIITTQSALENLIEISVKHKETCKLSKPSISFMKNSEFCKHYSIKCSRCFMDEKWSSAASVTPQMDYVTLRIIHAYFLSGMQKVTLRRFMECNGFGSIHSRKYKEYV